MRVLLLTLCCLPSAQAVTLHLSVRVQATCEVLTLSDQELTLRCTKDFQPAEPGLVPGLSGALPARQMTLLDSAPAPQGGTLNRYALGAPTDPVARRIFY